jgi:cell division protein FtsW
VIGDPTATGTSTDGTVADGALVDPPVARGRVGIRHGPLAAVRGLADRPLASYYLLLSSAGLLLVIGLVMVFSATSVQAYATSGDAYASVTKQALSALVGLVAFWIFQRLPSGTYRALGFPLVVLSALLLILLDLIGLLASARHVAATSLGPLRGDASNNLWLYLGPLQLQPSELAKLALALWGAHVLATKAGAASTWRELSQPLFPVAAVLLALVGMNDFGTMVCLFIVFVALLWAAGVRLRIFAAMGAIAVAGMAVLVLLPAWHYRLTRLASFADRSHCDPSKDCYQALHAMYAIADGGWFGVGLGQGRLKWGWLPNGHNDFIFAVIAEELGVVGCLVVLALFGVLAYAGLRIARRVDDPFRRMVATAITAWLVGQTAINIGGVVGLLPITGLPLPFISDGGSALVVTMAAVGLLASFARAEPDAARALHARPPDRWVRLLWAPLPPLPRQPAQPPLIDAAAVLPLAARSGGSSRGRPGRLR